MDEERIKNLILLVARTKETEYSSSISNDFNDVTDGCYEDFWPPSILLNQCYSTAIHLRVAKMWAMVLFGQKTNCFSLSNGPSPFKCWEPLLCIIFSYKVLSSRDQLNLFPMSVTSFIDFPYEKLCTFEIYFDVLIGKTSKFL